MIAGRPIVLNVAGNSESTCRGIERVADEFMRELIEKFKGDVV